MRIPSGSTDRYVYFVAVDATDLKTRETGLGSWTVVYSRNGGADTTYTTPTVTEVDNATMPGVYALLLDEGTTIGGTHDTEEYVVHITDGASAMSPVTRTVELYRPETTEGETLTVSSGVGEADAVQISGDSTAADNLELFFDGTGYNAANSTVGTVTDVTNQVSADMTAISGDTVAADNLEAMLDGTGGVGLTLNKLTINANDAAGAIDIDNAGGPGIKVDGTPYGIHIESTHATDTRALFLEANSAIGRSAGLYVTGATAGAEIVGSASGASGVKAIGGNTAWGLIGQGGLGGIAGYALQAGGWGIYGTGLSADATGGGARFYSDAGTGLKIDAVTHGIDIDASAGPGIAVNGTTYGVYTEATGATGTGLYIEGGGYGIQSLATGATVSYGMRISGTTGSVSGYGLHIQGRSRGIEIDATTLTSGIAINAEGGSSTGRGAVFQGGTAGIDSVGTAAGSPGIWARGEGYGIYAQNLSAGGAGMQIVGLSGDATSTGLLVEADTGAGATITGATVGMLVDGGASGYSIRIDNGTYDDDIANVLSTFDATADTVDVGAISGDTTAADNLELFFDGTGYDAANSTIGTVGVIDTDGITRASLAAETGLQSIRSNTAQAGGATSITLDASASATDDLYVGEWVLITGGTGVGQTRAIQAYDGTTKEATVARTWETNPDNTSTFAILPAAKVQGVTVLGAVDVGSISGDTTAADNLEAILDGTGAVMTLTQLRINSSAAGGAIDIDNSSGGAGIAINTATGVGINVTSSSSQGVAVSGTLGMSITGTSDDGLAIASVAAKGIDVQSFGGPGISIAGTTHGIDIDANAGVGIEVTSTGYGMHVDSSGADGIFVDGGQDGIRILGAGQGVDIDGGSQGMTITGSASTGVVFQGGGSNPGLYVLGGGGYSIEIDNGVYDDDIANVLSTFDASADTVDVGAISGDTTAADNLEAALDGTGGVTLYTTERYLGSVWIDTVNGAAGTTVGVHGTPDNPVDSLADARTLANAIGLRSYMISGGSNIVAGADHTEWRFEAVDGTSQINLQNRDFDNSKFVGLRLVGAQGGTGTIYAYDCDLQACTNLEIVATRCAISANITVRAGESIFTHCYSAVAGNATPEMTFASGAATNISYRLYSGGLQVNSMVAGQTMSYDCPVGQLVLDASCTGGALSRRGLHRLTDNSGGAVTVTDGFGMTINTDAAENVTVATMTAAALADFFDTDSGTTYGAAVAGSVVKEIVDNAGGGGGGDITSIMGTPLTETSAGNLAANFSTFYDNNDALTTNVVDNVGAGAGFTLDQMADAVWDEALSGHTVDGTAGASLACVYCPTATAVERDYQVTNQGTGLPIQGALVWITPVSAPTQTLWSGYSNASGYAVDMIGNKPYLEAGTYWFYVFKPGYTFTLPDEETYP